MINSVVSPSDKPCAFFETLFLRTIFNSFSANNSLINYFQVTFQFARKFLQPFLLKCLDNFQRNNRKHSQRNFLRCLFLSLPENSERNSYFSVNFFENACHIFFFISSATLSESLQSISLGIDLAILFEITEKILGTSPAFFF